MASDVTIFPDGLEMTPDFCLPRLVAANAARIPGVVWAREVTGETLTFGDAWDSGLRWAAALRTLGIHAGDNVVVMMPPGNDVCLIWLALSSVGAVFTPVNTEFEGPMLAHVLSASQTALVITLERYLPVLARVEEALVNVKTVVVIDSARESTLGPSQVIGRRVFEELAAYGTVQAVDIQPWDLACMPFTSGTTGPSKGVLVTWSHVYYNALRTFEGITDQDVIFSPLPTYHLGGLNAIFRMALVGGTVVLREKFSGTEFWDDIRNNGCTMTLFAGGMSYFVYRRPEQPDDADNPLRRAVMFPVIPEYEDFKRRFGLAQLSSGYSMTELSAPIWFDQVDDFESCGVFKSGPPFYSVRLVDEHDLEVPIGTPGEMVVRTEKPHAFAAGYFGMPQATADSLRNAWFHTGDIFRVDESGRYYFIDRSKDALRRRGELISSFEVERQLLEHPAVAEAAVVGVPSEWGEQEVKAVLVLVEGGQLDPGDLIEFLKPRMARFMLPRYVEIIEQLPRTQTQKVMKHLLRDSGVCTATWDREQVLPSRARNQPNGNSPR
jgi:carnitine-CoA ligase